MANLCKFYNNKTFLLRCTRKAVSRHLYRIPFKRGVIIERTQVCDRVHLNADNECGTEELKSVQELVSGNLLVYDNFISKEEEMMLYEEVRPSLEKRSYQHEHWDDVSTTNQFLPDLYKVYLKLKIVQSQRLLSIT